MKKIYFFAAAALALTACSNDDKYADNGPVAAQITANIGESTMSRATGTAWDKGDKIGITTFRENELGVNESKYVNMEYITENASAPDSIFTLPFSIPFYGNQVSLSMMVLASSVMRLSSSLRSLLYWSIALPFS